MLWDDALPNKSDLLNFTKSLPAQASVPYQYGALPEASKADDMHIMICPLCSQPNVAQSHKLKQDNLEIRLQCSNCCMRPISARWLCNCGVTWHTCNRHATHKAALSKAKGSRTDVASKASKRRLIEAPLEQILDDDLRRESKQARTLMDDEFITLGHIALNNSAVSLGMIPPKLRERFPDAGKVRN